MEELKFASGFELGCLRCGLTGYEDYPSNKKPCRIKGHKEKYEHKVFVPTTCSASGLDLNFWITGNVNFSDIHWKIK